MRLDGQFWEKANKIAIVSSIFFVIISVLSYLSGMGLRITNWFSERGDIRKELLGYLALLGVLFILILLVLVLIGVIRRRPEEVDEKFLAKELAKERCLVILERILYDHDYIPVSPQGYTNIIVHHRNLSSNHSLFRNTADYIAQRIKDKWKDATKGSAMSYLPIKPGHEVFSYLGNLSQALAEQIAQCLKIKQCCEPSAVDAEKVIFFATMFIQEEVTSSINILRSKGREKIYSVFLLNHIPNVELGLIDDHLCVISWNTIQDPEVLELLTS